MATNDHDDSFLHIVKPHEEGKMLRQVLQSRFRFSRRMLRRLRESRGVTVNDQVIYFTARVSAGDRIRVGLPQDPELSVEPQPVPLRIVFEDADVVVLDKEAGQVVHPTKNYRSHTLANGLVYYWLQRGEHRLARPVTRLDKDTSGLILFAKHAYAHAYLAKEMAKRRYRREYLAVVHGRWPQEQAVITDPIGRSPDQPHKRMVRRDGKEAITHVKVMRRFQEATLVQLRLETGRTHQIRVHLSHRGHPIVGDPLYGWKASEHYGISRTSLHAFRLIMIHPRDGQAYRWESPMPEDMHRLIDIFTTID